MKNSKDKAKTGHESVAYAAAVAGMETPGSGGSLSETLAVLLPPAAEPGSIFPSPLFATSDLPSDSVLPLSSRFSL